jgi:hypothetical protein
VFRVRRNESECSSGIGVFFAFDNQNEIRFQDCGQVVRDAPNVTE